MSDSKLIKDRAGRLLGRIVEDGGERRAYDQAGHLVGRYNKRADQTHDGVGRLVTTSGDALSGLLFGRRK
jgi:YD repeat-containing protein